MQNQLLCDTQMKTALSTCCGQICYCFETFSFLSGLSNASAKWKGSMLQVNHILDVLNFVSEAKKAKLKQVVM